MKNLKAEMVRRGLGISDLQHVLGCSEWGNRIYHP